MPPATLIVEREGALAHVTLNRPQALNALNEACVRELMAAIRELRRDGVRCVVLGGAGDRAFCAGADIAAMAGMTAVEGRQFSRLGQRLMRAIEDFPAPVIAGVNGFALGGGLELALACDFIVAGDSAKFGQPEINIGIIPGFGGTQRLARRVGIAKARELIYTGTTIGAEEAARLGLVNRVVAAATLPDEVRRLAMDLARKAPVALDLAKSAINAGADSGLMAGCRHETEAFAVAFASEDRAEGMRAFVEKRPPDFRGR